MSACTALKETSNTDHNIITQRNVKHAVLNKLMTETTKELGTQKKAVQVQAKQQFKCPQSTIAQGMPIQEN